MTAKVGSTANSYEILSKLAEGGMAEIFLARSANSTGVRRHVVLKRVARERALDTQYVRMFLDEARLAALLQHPNIAQVFDIGRLGESYFFTMEYVHGVTVQALVERARDDAAPLPFGAVLAIVAGAAAGLGHAHQRVGLDGRPLNIVHRDVSPSNLMVSFEGHVKVVDFGVAKAVGRPETQAGEIKGKVAYLSPEQCRQMKLDARSDLFSLGIVMWEMLTAKRLFKRDTAFETMAVIATERVAPPSTLRPDIPPMIDALVERMLALDPNDRYQNANVLIEAIELVAQATSSALSPATLARLLRERFGMRPEPWLALERDAVTVIAAPIPADLAAAADPEGVVVEEKLTTQFSSVTVTPMTPTPTPVDTDTEEESEHTRTTNVILAVSASARETREVPLLANQPAKTMETTASTPVEPTDEMPTQRDPHLAPKRTAIRGSTSPPVGRSSALPPPTRGTPRPPTRPPAVSAAPFAPVGSNQPIAAQLGVGVGVGSNGPVTVKGSGPYVPAASSAAAMSGSGPRAVIPGPRAVGSGPRAASKPGQSLRWWILGGSALGVVLTTIIVVATREHEAEEAPVLDLQRDAAPLVVAVDAVAIAVDAEIPIDAEEPPVDASDVIDADVTDEDADDLGELSRLDNERRPAPMPPRRKWRTKEDLYRVYAAKRYKEVVATCAQIGADGPRAIICTLAACRARNNTVAQEWYRNVAPARREATVKQCNASGGKIEDFCTTDMLSCRR